MYSSDSLISPEIADPVPDLVGTCEQNVAAARRPVKICMSSPVVQRRCLVFDCVGSQLAKGDPKESVWHIVVI